MNLVLPLPPGNYRSPTQQVRVASELWAEKNAFCPACRSSLLRSQNNTRVLDFRCERCSLTFELKSKKGPFGRPVVDGAFSSMMEVILKDQQPNFFLMSYSMNRTVATLNLIPRHFIVPYLVEKRKPLSVHARRAGWVGCNLRLSVIRLDARVCYVQNGQEVPPDLASAQWKRNAFLGQLELRSRGWLIVVMTLIERLNKPVFQLKDLYQFAPILRGMFPNNKNIEPKIRQQLQLPRDQKRLNFLGQGSYARIA